MRTLMLFSNMYAKVNFVKIVPASTYIFTLFTYGHLNYVSGLYQDMISTCIYIRIQMHNASAHCI